MVIIINTKKNYIYIYLKVYREKYNEGGERERERHIDFSILIYIYFQDIILISWCFTSNRFKFHNCVSFSILNIHPFIWYGKNVNIFD